MTDNPQKIVTEFRREVRRNPIRFIRDFLGVELWVDQERAVEAVRDNKRVAWRSGNNVGKTLTVAVLTVWYLVGWEGYVVLTSSSWRGIEKSLFPEIRQLISRAKMPLGGEVLNTEWKIGTKHGAFGVSADREENFAGFRGAGGNVFVIIDEGSDLDNHMMNSIEGLTSGERGKIFIVGNPLRNTGPFRDTFSNPGWVTLHTSTLDSPNVKAGKEIIPGLATREWCKSRAREWGTGSPAYESRILGEFPSEGEAAVIPFAWIERIQGTKAAKGKRKRKRLGVDVARFGNDRTVLIMRDDCQLLSLDEWVGQNLMQTVGEIIRKIKEDKIDPEDVFVDDTGLGGGVTDRLHEQGYMVTPINAGAKAHESDRFLNQRAECFWMLRDAVDPDGEIQFKIPAQYAEVLKEISVPQRAMTSKGQIKLEEKKEIRRRLGRSPDYADALAMTFAYREPQEELWVA